MPKSSFVTPKPRDTSRLSGERFDVLIIGGGITGAGIARDLALRGATVVLVEQDDFASGTSSRSTKLIHGGLRYLENFDLGLVFEACRERFILQQIAPHLVRPLPLMIPLYRSARRSRTLVHAGLTLYDLLALGRNTHAHRMLSSDEASQRQPLLDPHGLTGAALYWDCRMDDARLCLENVIAAREAGAVAVNYTRVSTLLRHGGRIAGAVVEDRENQDTLEVSAKVVVNATGPWLDRVGAMAGNWTPRLRPTRGAHLLVSRLPGGEEALYLSADRDDRRFFVIPWGDLSLIGTTDLDDCSPPEDVAVTAGEVDYLLAEAARYLPGAKLSARDIVSTFAGIRPLLAGHPGHESSVSREHALFESPDGLISIGGGKYTTYRSMAAEVADRVMARLGRPRGEVRTHALPLPGGQPGWDDLLRDPPANIHRHGLDPDTLHRLVDRYGTRTAHLLNLLDQEPELAAPVAPGAPLGVEIAYAVDFEMARTPEDILRRRSPQALLPGHGLAAVDAVAAVLGRRLSLPPEHLATLAGNYRQTYSDPYSGRHQGALA
ncbi:MAG: glycerol-3-phosphate dehydrogenase [Desulfuromonadales bacterium]|nr:glycerol-3-phosphate dehydrogenase [Desulfuromonadales bacterium]